MKLFGNIFKNLLISESRKEDLFKKYSNKFKNEDLIYLINLDELDRYNQKYTDFFLKSIPSDGDIDTLSRIGIDLIIDFDKYQSKLEKKDINQYKNFEELEKVLEPFKIKEKEKNLEKQVDKIYEDERFLVLIPKTEEASCKYGSNTKWCVTSKGSGHFFRYTSNNQRLYFIINKEKSKENSFSKIAVHFNRNGNPGWWDSKDEPMSQREIEIFKYAFPEVVSAIIDDFKKFESSLYNINIDKIFDSKEGVSESYRNFLNSGKELEIVIKNFERLPDLGKGHAIATLKIFLKNDNYPHNEIDQYELFIQYKQNNSSLFIDIGFQGFDFGEDSTFIDLGLEGASLKLSTTLPKTSDFSIEPYHNLILHNVSNLITHNKFLIEKLKGHSITWKPNRISYGYTFKENKGLIKKLVDYLDAGYDNGTKLDFLEYIGKIKSKTINGKKHYAHADSDDYNPSSYWRGHFSAFFASAKNADIIQYTKEGNKNLIKKGPNFENFKEGKLIAL